MLNDYWNFNWEVNRTIQVKCCNYNYGIKRDGNKQRTIFRRNKEAKNWQTVYVEQYKLNAVTINYGSKRN